MAFVNRILNQLYARPSPALSSVNMMQEGVQEAIANIQKAASADSTGAGQAHSKLLEAIQRLQLAVESPQETLMRIRFEVCGTPDL